MNLLSWYKLRLLVYLGLAFVCYDIYLSKNISKNSLNKIPNESTKEKMELPIEGVSDIFSGDYFTCALSMTGKVFCWGFDPASPFLSIPSKIPKKVQVEPFSDILLNKKSYTDKDEYQTYGLLTSFGVTFEHIYARGGYRCGLTPQHDLYCWGHYLNKTNMAKINKPQPIFNYLNLPINNLKFKKLALGFHHICGITIYADLYCWGENTFGQLGEEASNYSEEPLYINLK